MLHILVPGGNAGVETPRGHMPPGHTRGSRPWLCARLPAGTSCTESGKRGEEGGMRGNGRDVGWGGAGSEQKPLTNDLVGLFLSLARSSPSLSLCSRAPPLHLSHRASKASPSETRVTSRLNVSPPKDSLVGVPCDVSTTCWAYDGCFTSSFSPVARAPGS